MKRFIAILTIIGFCAGSGYSFGARGHRLIGAIADRRLANSKNEALKKKLAQLLDGMTLERVATLPDSIKAWDQSSDSFQLIGHPKIEDQLRAFVNANPAAGRPSHHEFHFTDVPVFGNEKYADGKVGRSDFDIVHMIPFCIRVLKGQEPEPNKRAITKTVAVILLAHYLGDIHQPLHVGAEYFDDHGQPVEPTAVKPGYGDQGGNRLNLFLQEKKLSVGNLHGFWDNVTVVLAFFTIPDQQTADELAREEPEDWKLNSPVENWAETLANEVLPLAGEAHDRLEFKHLKVDPSARDIVSGDAFEKKTPDGLLYEKWASQKVKQQIHKAGWRLAALLEEVLK